MYVPRTPAAQGLSESVGGAAEAQENTTQEGIWHMAGERRGDARRCDRGDARRCEAYNTGAHAWPRRRRMAAPRPTIEGRA